jgi:hypothetical protein
MLLACCNARAESVSLTLSSVGDEAEPLVADVLA